MTSKMAMEIAEIPAVLEHQYREGHRLYADLGAHCATQACPMVLTVARGSSETAAAYGRALLGLVAKVPTAAFPLSAISVYGAPPRVRNALALGISQSGASPDLRLVLKGLQDGGALTAALVNDTGAPLAEAAQAVLPMMAGAERAVAAQKSCLAAMAALAGLAAGWGEDRLLGAALADLPAATAGALDADWSALGAVLADARSVLVVARGPALAAAAEMALKIKELLGLHAEAISSAEVLHGPVALGGRGLGVIALAPPDEGQSSTMAAVEALRARGSHVVVTGDALPAVAAPHPLLSPLVVLASFYATIEALTRHRGFDPDEPFGLNKVTLTV